MRLPTGVLLLAVAALFGVVTARAGADAPRQVELEGVKAVVTAPEGWEQATDTPAAGQWRVVFRGPKLAKGGAQCEARVFPVKETQEAVSVLMQAADQVSRQVGGDGFGVPELRALKLEGRPAAEAQLVVQAGSLRLEGRIRLLRAAGTAWAMAWGLAPPDAPPEVLAVARGFASSLTPSEPAFYEPAPPAGDPEETIVAPPGEDPVRRRHLQAVIDALEAGSGVRLPQNVRAEVYATLREDALHGGAAARSAYRDTARTLHEARGESAQAQQALRAEVGKRLFQALEARQESGHAPAQRLALIFGLGRQPGAGTAEDGLTRFEVEVVLEGLAFLGALGADQALELSVARRATLREVLSARWKALDAEGRAALKRFATAAPALASTWQAATPTQRFHVRAGVAALVLLPRGPAGTAPPAPPADLKALRACLDANPRAPEAWLEALQAAPPAELVRLADLLPSEPPPK